MGIRLYRGCFFKSRLSRWVGNAAQQGAGLVFSNTNAMIPRSFLVKFSQSLQYPKQCCKDRYKYAIISFLFSHPVGRQSVLSPPGLFFPKGNHWQPDRSFHKGRWEVSDTAHKTLKTLCSCCHPFASQLMQRCLYPVWGSIRFYLWQLLLLNFPQKAEIVCSVTVTSTLPVAAAAAGLDCVRNKS